MHSSYPLTGHHRNENILQRRCDFPNAGHAEPQLFSYSPDLPFGILRIFHRQVQLVAMHGYFLDARSLFKGIDPAKSRFCVQFQQARMKVRSP